MYLEVINDIEEKLELQSKNISDMIFYIKKQLREVEINMKSYEKDSTKVIKSLKKKLKFKENKTQFNNGERYGFARKKRIAEELLLFLKKDEIKNIVEEIVEDEKNKEKSSFEYLDEENRISLPSVTKIINKYIKNNNLQNKKNKRFFIPDSNLLKILSPLNEEDKKNGGYTYFNLQKYTKHLYEPYKTL